MPTGSKPAIAISLAELTVLAMDDRERRYDWSWLMCFYIREWEKEIAAAYEQEGKKLINAHFGWFHYHEICDRTLAKAEHHIAKVKTAIQVKDNMELSGYTRFLIRDILRLECAREFASLTEAVAANGLKLFDETQKGKLDG